MYPLWPDTRSRSRTARQFCNAACKMRHARGQAPARPTFPALPAWHHGRFEDFATAYAGQVDDRRDRCPLRQETFAHLCGAGGVCRRSSCPAAGWCVSRAGMSIRRAMQCWEAMPNLHYVTASSYVMDGHGAKPPSASPARGTGVAAKGQAAPRTSGMAPRRPAAGELHGRDSRAPSGPWHLDQQQFKWQQSLVGFERTCTATPPAVM